MNDDDLKKADAEYEHLIGLIAAERGTRTTAAGFAKPAGHTNYLDEALALHAVIWRLREDNAAWSAIAAQLSIPEAQLSKVRMAALELGLAVKDGSHVRWLPPGSRAARPHGAQSSASRATPVSRLNTCWGIHGRRPRFEMVRDGQLVLEREGVGDLAACGGDRRAIEAELRASHPHAPEGRLRAWATVLARFYNGPAVGDLVAHPDPVRRTISLVRITGEYEFDAPARHTRSVSWSVTGMPRDELSPEAQKGVSQLVAFFSIRQGIEEVLARIRSA